MDGVLVLWDWPFLDKNVTGKKIFIKLRQYFHSDLSKVNKDI
jgi:hypothetical protein